MRDPAAASGAVSAERIEIVSKSLRSALVQAAVLSERGWRVTERRHDGKRWVVTLEREQC